MAHRTDNHSDLTLFKNRLWKLMEKKDIYTTKKLAKMLYDQKLVTVKQKYSYDEPSKIYGNAIGAIDKKIQKHLNADTAKELQGEFVIAYCTFFGCSSDYLFGFIDCKTHDDQFIHDETGLSEIAINRLQDAKAFSDIVLNDPAIPFISKLIEQLDPIYYNDILHEIAAYLRSDGLNQDMWYNVESMSLFNKECNRGKDFNFPIPAHSEIFDNLLLMDIQERLKHFKSQLKKAPDTT